MIRRQRKASEKVTEYVFDLFVGCFILLFVLTPMDQLPQKNCVFGGVGTHSSRAFMVVHVGVM